MKSYNGKINSNIHNNKLPKERSQFICLSVFLSNFAFRTSKNYYPQMFLQECKYVVKEKKISKHIIGDIEISSDSERENSDEENSNEENFKEKNFKKY